MKLNLLNKEELTNLYKDEMMFDFPRAELKPLRAMLRLMDMGQYDPLLVTDDQGVALGYAMIWLPRARNGALLEYLGVLRGKRNGGLGAARNTGMEAARGEYLVFLDSDDYLAPHMLETLRQRIEATHCDVYTFGFFVDKNGDTSERHLDDLLVGIPFTLAEYPRLLLASPNAWNRIYRRSFFLPAASGLRTSAPL